MITVQFYQTPERGTIHMHLRGHANAAPQGEDLVCAGATTLAFALAQSLQFMHDQGGLLKRAPRLKLQGGNADIVAAPTEEGFAQILQSFWVIQAGFFVLAKNYQGHVQMEVLKA